MSASTGRVVIACYRPLPGRERDLHALARTHVPRLRAQGLATERTPIVAVAADGTVVEVFEWVSAAAIVDAHTNPAVQAMWAEYAEVSTYVPVGDLFPEFTPLG